MHANLYEITKITKPEYPILESVFSDMEVGLTLTYFNLCEKIYDSVDMSDVYEIWVNDEFIGTPELVYYLGSFREINVYMLNDEEYHIKLLPIE